MLENLVGTEYAEALKEAITMRRNGTITPAVDDQLGLMAYSISRWVICDALRKNKLMHETARDEDFRSQVLLGIIERLDRVDISREPKEIIKYLYMVGRSAIKGYIETNSRQKRQHEDVPVESVVLEADFYGRRTGACAVVIENDSRGDMA